MEESIDHRSSCQNSCDGCSQDSQQSVTVGGDDCHHHGDNAVYVPAVDRNVNNIYSPFRDYSAYDGHGLAASAQCPASQLPTLNYQPTRSYFTTDMAASRGCFDPIRSASRAPSFVSSYPPTYMPSYEPSYSFPPVPPQSPLPPRPPVTPDAPTSSVPLSYANNELPPRVDSDNRTCIHNDCFRRWLDENEDSPSNKDVQSYLGDELSYVYSSEESSSCSGKEEEEWNSSDELDWEGFQDFSAPLSNEDTIETTTGNGHTTNETFEDNENQEESQRLTDSTNGRINTSNVSRECTPSQEDGHGDMVFLYAIENSDIDHVDRQGKPLTLRWLHPLYLSGSY